MKVSCVAGAFGGVRVSRMEIILLGPSGIGKRHPGSRGSRSPLGYPKYLRGDMLRQAVAEKTVLGQEVGDIINQGRLVPNDLIISVIKDRISRADCDNGFILDGFPQDD